MYNEEPGKDNLADNDHGRETLGDEKLNTKTGSDDFAKIIFDEDIAPIGSAKAEKTQEEKEFNILHEIYEWVEAVSYALVAVVLVFTFLLRMVWVDGSSMNYTLYDGDRVIISNFMYEPKNKDIVVVTVDDPEFINRPLIKRIIAVEGQTIDFDRDAGAVVVDGKVLNEPYIAEAVMTYGDNHFPLTVPKGQVFVMGDNRNHSYDSRYEKIGTIDVHHILGRVVLRVYPFNRIGNVK